VAAETGMTPLAARVLAYALTLALRIAGVAASFLLGWCAWRRDHRRPQWEARLVCSQCGILGTAARMKKCGYENWPGRPG
jgi:hypothetical protein